MPVPQRVKLPLGHSRYAPKLPDIHDFPIVRPGKAHMINTKKYYPSGPQLHQTRLKYPYLSAQCLAEDISEKALTNKSQMILKELSQALGNVATGKLARPVTGMVVKLSGVTNVEKVRPLSALLPFPPGLDRSSCLTDDPGVRSSCLPPFHRTSRRSSITTEGRCRTECGRSSSGRGTERWVCGRPTSRSSRPPSPFEEGHGGMR